MKQLLQYGCKEVRRFKYHHIPDLQNDIRKGVVMKKTIFFCFSFFVVFCTACILHAGVYVGTVEAATVVRSEMSRPNPHSGSQGFRQSSDLPDLSGLVWLGGDRFLAVHDAKTVGESGNRASACSLYLLTRRVFCGNHRRSTSVG